MMHVRAQPGTRIEETARLFDVVEHTVRQIIPPEQLDNIVDNIGLPFSGINMAYQNTGTIGPEDGDALITLKEDHSPTEAFIKELRTTLPQKFPGTTFSFLPADIVSQILNFGLPAPIDVQVISNNQKANYAYATDLLKHIRTVPGIADLRIQQVFNYPQINRPVHLDAVVLVYLVIVVNFQSRLDPFIIITALPGALAGIVWMLFMTGTTLSVPALTGAVMCMGIATANSILLVSFARKGLAQGLDAATAALEAGFTRFRPVLMTALAMIIGMLPMAFALGEGGEQNAPLGRAVIGGLLVATIATLFFVPTVFTVLHSRRDGRPEAPQPVATG
jgi:multidrug efflux pump subunit AcrB